MVKVGDYIKITSKNENYRPYCGHAKYHRVTKVARAQGWGHGKHPGYDTGMKGEALVDCSGLPFSLYEYEFVVVKKK
jgi:hypothetical protein